MMWALRPLDERCGLVVEAGTRSILDLDPALVKPWVEQHGAVLLRSTSTDVNTFVQLSDRFMARAMVHGAVGRRQMTDDDTVQEVTAGTDEVDLHAELAQSPRRPDLLWFFCARPADVGGETTVCDGVRVFAALQATTQARFLTTRVRSLTAVPAESLRRLYPGLTYEQAVEAGQRQAAAGFSITMTPEGAVAEYVTSAVTLTRWGQQRAFANAIFGPYPLRKQIGFEDGEPIPEGLLAEIKAVTAREMVCVRWQSGDVILIDNSRVLHGRRPFSGPRSILVRMGAASW